MAMTLEENLRGFAEAVGVDHKSQEDKITELITKIGNLTELDTVDKTNLVLAINEVLSRVGEGSGSVDPTMLIDDLATVLNKTWSSTKINTFVNELKTSLESKMLIKDTQTLTQVEKDKVIENLGLNDIVAASKVDYLAIYTDAKNGV